jgi:hypothetical protein
MVLFDPELVKTDGCPTPNLGLSPQQAEFLQSVIRGDVFFNPVDEALNGALNEINGFLDAAINVPQLSGVVSSLSNVVNVLQDFQDHGRRLSGLIANPQNAPGLAGINSIAKTYNNIKNALENGNIGDALVDHYSPFFQSILGPGNLAVGFFKDLIEGDFRGAFYALAAQAATDPTGGAASALLNLTESLSQAINLIDIIRQADELAVAAALEYIGKYTLGFSALEMLEDPCFSQKILQNITNPGSFDILNT